jgi:hypothetical protein
MKNPKLIINYLIFFIVLGSFFYYKEFYLKKQEKSKSSIIETTEEEIISNDSNEQSTSVCNICGEKFNGNGYEEQIDGSFKELENPYSNQICSPTCARKASQKLDDVANKYGIDIDETNNNMCHRCNGHYVEGFCNMCGGASPERVNQSNQNRADCEMCQGKKYIDGYNGIKICSVCNGTGKITY